ncbi:MAG: hypothetical protein COA67_09005 [Lutibacter sp.]|nr:MAG: hypothetical protein COA67_09005 [Lutibacter sp.]
MEIKKNTIEYVAYIVKKAKRKNEPKPIIFLGAGASVTAGIPLTDAIVADVKKKHKDNPVIKGMIDSGETNYYKIMGALESDDRKDLFYEYITDDKVKINVTKTFIWHNF